MGEKRMDIFSVSGYTLASNRELALQRFLLDPHHPNVFGHKMLCDLLKYMYIPMLLDILQRPVPARAYARQMISAPPPSNYSAIASRISNSFASSRVYCFLTYNPLWGRRGDGVLSTYAPLQRTSTLNQFLRIPRCGADNPLMFLVDTQVYVVGIQSLDTTLSVSMDGEIVDMQPDSVIAPWLRRGRSNPTRWYSVPSTSSDAGVRVDICCVDCVRSGATAVVVAMSDPLTQNAIDASDPTASSKVSASFASVSIPALVIGALLGGLIVGGVVAMLVAHRYQGLVLKWRPSQISASAQSTNNRSSIYRMFSPRRAWTSW
mmetsp:Transcript_29879/g.48242  ORF Transcript_29879/g.48242 Transcript_29879/m.48242 type:complete len:319 (-) Transcript_29879:68-1024(-)